jgi:hypothetical protein
MPSLAGAIDGIFPSPGGGLLASEPLTVEGGAICVPTGLGLGIQLDESKVAALTVDTDEAAARPPRGRADLAEEPLELAERDEDYGHFLGFAGRGREWLFPRA